MQTPQPTDASWVKSVANWKIGAKPRTDSPTFSCPDCIPMPYMEPEPNRLTTHPLSEHDRVFGERLAAHDTEYGRD